MSENQSESLGTTAGTTVELSESPNLPHTNDNLMQMSYPGAEVLLEAARVEYEFESKRKAGLETRAGLLMAFSSSVLVFAASTLTIPKFTIALTVTESLYTAFFLLLFYSMSVLHNSRS